MKANKKPRMTKLDQRMVVEEIETWAKGERGKKLSWTVLERIFGFSRQTLASKSEIREALERAKKSLKNVKSGRVQTLGTTFNDLTEQKYKNRIKELELQIDELHKLFIEKHL